MDVISALFDFGFATYLFLFPYVILEINKYKKSSSLLTPNLFNNVVIIIL